MNMVIQKTEEERIPHLKTAVIGGGAWGTAMAVHLSRSGHDVAMWVREEDVIESINQFRHNPFLSGIRIPANIKASHDIQQVLRHADAAFWAVPVQHMRSVIEQVSEIPELQPDLLATGTIHVNLSKGVEQGSLQFPLEILNTYFGAKGNFAVLSGPSFATPFAVGLPTVLVAASESEKVSELLQNALQYGNIRIYTSNDPLGVQIGGAFKNVYAIAAGISDGMGLAENARAAIITRAIVELTRLGHSLGARDQTIAGAAGLGDLILTCTSRQSRNYTFGHRIGMGEKPDVILATMNKAVEGYHTLRAELGLAEKKNVEIPIAEAIDSILYGDTPPKQAMSNLLARPSKPEWWF